MTHDVFMAGFGGQGVLLIGNLLAQAAILEGKNASYFPAYGVEKRGGAATCTVVISADEIGSPVVGRPGAGLILNQASMDKYFERIRPGGFCVVNTSLVEVPRGGRDDLALLEIPVNELALEIGDARLGNMIVIGAYAEQSGAVSLQNLQQALAEVLPERNHRFIPLNVKAIELGASLARKAAA
ncbi:2-oxoacid:ferredoxin oxidoreductase subunit gamma [Desulfuromonas versatilis]|uniref:2-oxoacid:ferredoxin oxidoreductase subunit gamma n=1 Tax=Desulfuromonas versatilis TaxID=2802975 RepID=A0ABM8HRA1_9BACT|nr:2-oxoacid:acceptor oxidoreductase family protein [Desulfuromonas versatilis]BCR04817.1 2-oxoacid:ferredoxin oxidoreductase subunit gamma [Desulfuromonas versatilis]